MKRKVLRAASGGWWTVSLIIINGNRLEVASVSILVSFDVRAGGQPSPVIIPVGDALVGKSRSPHGCAVTPPCCVTAINDLVTEYLQCSSLVKRNSIEWIS